MFSKILLASDGSDCALKAAHVAADLATKYGGTVTVLNVFSIPTSFVPLAGMPGFEMDPAAVNHYADHVRDAVARRTGKVLEEHGVPYETRQVIGHPAETIVNVAEREHYDLIVVGSRGLSGIKGFLLGSVSDRVAHHAHCPVLIVK
jgi:nucleotide-binding universal stress UspA family protein